MWTWLLTVQSYSSRPSASSFFKFLATGGENRLVTEGFSTSLWNEFQAQRELGAWLTMKLGKTRLKWQLACGEEPSLLSRYGIRQLTGTAVDKADSTWFQQRLFFSGSNSNNSARTRRNNRRCNRKISLKQLTYIRFLQLLKTKEYNRNINRNHLELNEY